MADTLAGYPFWKLNFNDKAELPGGAAAAAADIASKNLTDLFIFSHGWNNDEATAMKLYEGFFGEVADLLKDTKIPKKATLSVGIAGVIWPSILFPGDTVPATGSAAASFSSGGEAKTLESELPLVFVRPEQQDDLQALLKLLDEQTPDNNALLEFRDRLNSLVKADAAQNTTGTGMDDLEFLATTVQSDSEWLRILDAFSVQPADDGSGDAGGAADFGSFFGRLWNGAKNALRTATYWQMKNRAGVVGKNGLGPLVGAIRAAAPSLRVHLLGHSFGARLVSYSLAGLPDAALKPDSPVKSLFLLQGAFSHFAFATKLPFDSSRHGDLIGMEARVDGPLLTTHSLKDLAVGNAYPAASILSGQDASAAEDLMYRWEGMGHDGAQAVNAASAPLGDVQTNYPFERGKWINLDGNQIIVAGGPPSGAHSDIIHPETAWAALAAAGIATARANAA